MFELEPNQFTLVKLHKFIYKFAVPKYDSLRAAGALWLSYLILMASASVYLSLKGSLGHAAISDYFTSAPLLALTVLMCWATLYLAMSLIFNRFCEKDRDGGQKRPDAYIVLGPAEEIENDAIALIHMPDGAVAIGYPQ